MYVYWMYRKLIMYLERLRIEKKKLGTNYIFLQRKNIFSLDVSKANYVFRQTQNWKKMYRELIMYFYKGKNIFSLDVLCISTNPKPKIIKNVSGANSKIEKIYRELIMYRKNVSSVNVLCISTDPKLGFLVIMQNVEMLCN